jgi:hypothetical protein
MPLIAKSFPLRYLAQGASSNWQFSLPKSTQFTFLQRKQGIKPSPPFFFNFFHSDSLKAQTKIGNDEASTSILRSDMERIFGISNNKTALWFFLP